MTHTWLIRLDDPYMAHRDRWPIDDPYMAHRERSGGNGPPQGEIFEIWDTKKRDLQGEMARRRRNFFRLGAKCGPLQVKNGKFGSPQAIFFRFGCWMWPLQVKNGKYGPPQAKKNELIRTPLGIFGKNFGVNKDPPKISDFEILMKIGTPLF